MSRCIFVSQTNTNRIIPKPLIEDHTIREILTAQLAVYAELKGQVVETAEAYKFYDEWYTENRMKHNIDDKKMAGYYQRKPDHLIRLAMIMTVSAGSDLVITQDTYERALVKLNELEVYMPDAFVEMEATSIGRDHARILRQIINAGGYAKHTDILKKNFQFMDSRRFRACIETLCEAGFIEASSDRPVYYKVIEEKINEATIT